MKYGMITLAGLAFALVAQPLLARDSDAQRCCQSNRNSSPIDAARALMRAELRP